MKRTLALLICLLSFSLLTAISEEAPKQFVSPDAQGVSFNIPEGVEITGDTVPITFKLKGLTVIGDFRVIPGDFDSFRDMVTTEMKADGWKDAGSVADIGKESELIRHTFTKEKNKRVYIFYPFAQGGHRFFYFKLDGEEAADVVASYLNSLFLTVKVKDVYKDDPPKNFKVNDEPMGLTFTVPWYWRKAVRSSVKYWYDVHFVSGFCNYVSISFTPDKGISLDDAVEMTLKAVRDKKDFLEHGNSPRNIGVLKGAELEFSYTSVELGQMLRERVLLVPRKKDLFIIKFVTLAPSYKAGLDDYIVFFKSITIDPRIEDEEEGEEGKGDEKPKNVTPAE